MVRKFRLEESQVKQLAAKYSTPVLLLDEDQIEYNYRFLKENMPRVKVFYAVKANPDERIIKTLSNLGSCFDVASDGEMIALTDLGVEADRMVYANPFKTPNGLAVAKKTGVNKFTFDSESEIYKMAKGVPGGTVLLRVRVDNPKALVDLNKKFGSAPEDTIKLLSLAKEAGLDVGGLCFHVGSQSPTAEAHVEALKICRRLFDEAKGVGFNLRILDIGGGFPIPTIESDVDVKGMMQEINATIEELFPNTEIWAEPGRYICGTAVN